MFYKVLLLLIFTLGGLMAEKMERATMGGGCFWCIEAVFDKLKGVKSAVSGYAGGAMENPDYKSVCSGKSGHAEVVQIEYDADVISYGELLDIFWSIHNPTTLNRQGNDIGTQYRSVIFYHDEAQKKWAEESIKKAQERFREKIVTEVAPLERFYEAEEYHQDYFANNPNQGYCQVVIAPKVEKFKESYSDRVKE